MTSNRLVRIGIISLGLWLALWLSFATGSTFPVASAADDPTQLAAQPAGILAQVVLTPTKDNTLYENAAGSTSNGVGPTLYVGKIRTGSLRRGLVFFDLAGKIPTTATITSVTLRLNLAKTNTGAQTVTIHKVTTDWGEGTSNAGGTGGDGTTATTNDATWIHTFFNTKQWQKAGGDFIAAASASTTVGTSGAFAWGSTPEMIADVQSWISNPASNFGWIIIGNEATNQTAQAFNTKESAAATQPQLTVVYQSPGDFTVRVYMPMIDTP